MYHQTHYEQLAETYDHTWTESRSRFVVWMADRIAAWLRLPPGSRIVDVGAGTGLFLDRLVESASATTPVVCVDPSQPMLDRLPDDARLLPVRATAEQIASGEVALPYDTLDVVVFKESIHHVTDIASTLRGLVERLDPNRGQILIVTLPQRLDYPLFDAALDRFASTQPDPEAIAKALADAGLHASVEMEEFADTFDRERWIDLVRGRWMSVLSTFDDDELADGIAEIRMRHPGRQVSYVDRFAFVCGRR